ncbi:sporulation-specific protein 5 [Pyricularia oryzae Y34]|nr:sporulation-specific protein 5 [Pyricularia oryzae Y34]
MYSPAYSVLYSVRYAQGPSQKLSINTKSRTLPQSLDHLLDSSSHPFYLTALASSQVFVKMGATFNDPNRRHTGVASGYPTVTESHNSIAAANAAMMPDGMGQMINQFQCLSFPAGAYVPTADPTNMVYNPYSQIHHLAGQAAAYDPMVQYHLGTGFPIAHPQTALMGPSTPRNVAAAHVPRELPTLENRRSSYSTSATESTPATPFFGAAGDRAHGARVLSTDRSTFTTPSPQQVLSSAVLGSISAKPTPVQDPELDRLLMQDPAIPRAVPAVFTDHVKTLEQCLENRISGNKNVYIRGLHPTTDDDLLLRYASRFGEVEQSKAIIDTSTGACKGFGFAKFKDIGDSQKCIRGFYRLGYEVGFARESFNARLKAEGDDMSTNLYISNLPKDITEPLLIHIFDPHPIASSKILRDSNGNSRGVGFARFESREVCERIIKNFNGLKLGVDGQEMQVRYADTPSQKELKRITAERRQYRTNEYNIGAYGTHAVGMSPSIYQQGSYGMRRSGSGGGSYNHTSRSVNVSGGYNGQGAQVTGRDSVQQNLTAPPTVTSDDGSGDEGVTIVDASPIGNVTAVSSPSVKKESKKEKA